jgi:hypothetical protein
MTAPEGAEVITAVPADRAVAFVSAVELTKQEVFEACQALADADRVLVAARCHDEASALGDLFQLLEQRLTSG